MANKKEERVVITPKLIRDLASWVDFGSEDPVNVVCLGLCKIATSYPHDFTVREILVSLRLVKKDTPTVLTRAGKRLIYSFLEGADFVKLLEMGNGTK